jgi:CheY-like chemotaxis protein
MKSAKVLIIDDERVILESVSRTLKKEGYETMTAGSLLEAVELLQNNKFDLIISDVMIPHIGGLELVDRLKTDPKFASTPVIIMTGMDRDILNATLTSADAILTKPFDSEQLLEQVKNQLQTA